MKVLGIPSACAVAREDCGATCPLSSTTATVPQKLTYGISSDHLKPIIRSESTHYTKQYFGKLSHPRWIRHRSIRPRDASEPLGPLFAWWSCGTIYLSHYLHRNCANGFLIDPLGCLDCTSPHNPTHFWLHRGCFYLYRPAHNDTIQTLVGFEALMAAELVLAVLWGLDDMFS